VPTALVLSVKGAIVDPAATVTEGGKVSPVSPVPAKVTTAPFPEAAFDRLTVQLLVAFDPRVVGVHRSEDTTVAIASERFADCDVPL
jgi:hypothetical protein